MKRRRNRRSISSKTIFVFVFIAVLAAAVISTSNTSGALIIWRFGADAPGIAYKHVCVDEDANIADNINWKGETWIEQTIKGQTNIIKKETDTCLTSTTLREYTCLGNRIYPRTVFCKYGCEGDTGEAGACKPCLNCIEDTCTDSDHGKVFSLTGVVEDDVTGRHIDECIPKADGIYVKEGFCSDGKYAYIEWRCPADCAYGACLKG